MRDNILAGAKIHSGGGYSLGTEEKYEEFARKRNQSMTSKEQADAVIQLHDIARLVERTIGHGQLSQDIRSVADRLNAYIKPQEK